jgi:hypothetical protein
MLFARCVVLEMAISGKHDRLGVWLFQSGHGQAIFFKLGRYATNAMRGYLF